MNNNINSDKYWAKTTIDDMPGLSVYDHMINVGSVACVIAALYPDILKHFNFKASDIGALAALHDLGKISPSFQRKCEEWIVKNDLVKVDHNYVWDTSMEADHGKVSQSAIHDCLLRLGVLIDSVPYLAAVLAAQGQPPQTIETLGYGFVLIMREPAAGGQTEPVKSLVKRLGEEVGENKIPEN